jgi:hypothetical protein
MIISHHIPQFMTSPVKKAPLNDLRNNKLKATLSIPPNPSVWLSQSHVYCRVPNVQPWESVLLVTTKPGLLNRIGCTSVWYKHPPNASLVILHLYFVCMFAYCKLISIANIANQPYIKINCSETKKWMEECVNSNWLNINEDLGYRKIISCTNVNKITSLTKYLFKTKCKWENKVGGGHPPQG